VYNQDDLRASFGKNHNWVGRTDTEVLATVLAGGGSEALSRISGDFALGLWDTEKRSGFIARDRVGVKPLYYALLPDGIVFASEITALLAAFPELRKVDPAAIFEYLTRRFVPQPYTAFAPIRKLAPGHWLRIGQSACDEPQRYWTMTFSDCPVPATPDLVQTARGLMESSVASPQM
jgi:asparagine synthase (glutamine-hydrolysing)